MGHIRVSLNVKKGLGMDAVWWPGINMDIEKLVNSYEICAKSQNDHAETMISGDFPSRPWEKLGSDLFYFNGQNYLLVVDFPGCLRLGLSWFNWWVSFAPEFQCCYFCESSCLFYLSFNFDFCVSKIMHL